MPVPTPRSGEDKTKFLARCHKFLHDENKNRKDKRSDEQISGICYSQWRDKKKGIIIRGEAIPILRSFESGGEKYLYGYAALFDSPDCFGTLCTREIVESSWEHLKKFPAVRFMHKTPLGQILFDEDVSGMSTFVDEHGFHVLVQVYDERDDEWGMITNGQWGFSYGLLPAPDGIKEKCLPNGSCYKAFVKGIFYEVSVVDTPAHSDAIAHVIRRFIHGDIGGVITEQKSTSVPEKLGTGGYACKVGDEWKLPINDAAHTRNAMARYNQAEGCQTSEVKARICAAAKHFNIENAFKKGGFCYKGEKRKMERKEIEELVTRIIKELQPDDKSGDTLKEIEDRITKRVTDAIQATKNESFVEDALKEMEDRIMKSLKEQVEKTLPEKKVTKIQKTFTATEKALKEMQERINKLKKIEADLKEAGEDSKALTARIAQFEKQYEDFSKTVVTNVEQVVNRQLGDMNKRVAAIENIPELRSVATSGESDEGCVVTRGFGRGFLGMLDELGEKQQ